MVLPCWIDGKMDSWFVGEDAIALSRQSNHSTIQSSSFMVVAGVAG
jgi:hypothetical protein